MEKLAGLVTRLQVYTTWLERFKSSIGSIVNIQKTRFRIIITDTREADIAAPITDGDSQGPGPGGLLEILESRVFVLS